MSKTSDEEVLVDNIMRFIPHVSVSTVIDDPLEELMNEFSYLDDDEEDFEDPPPTLEPFNAEGMDSVELFEMISQQMKTLEELKLRIRYYIDEIDTHIS